MGYPDSCNALCWDVKSRTISFHHDYLTFDQLFIELIYFITVLFTSVLSQRLIERAYKAQIHRFHLPNPLVATLQTLCFISSFLFAWPAALTLALCPLSILPIKTYILGPMPVDQFLNAFLLYHQQNEEILVLKILRLLIALKHSFKGFKE